MAMLLALYFVRVGTHLGGMALQRNPEAGLAMVEAGWEVASHG